MKLAALLIALAFTNIAFATDTYNCKFDRFSDPEGQHKENLELRFIHDKKAKKAYVLGNNGSSEVAYFDQGHGQSFVEITPIGNVMTTTIDIDMRSVHSRNTVGPLGKLLPSQYYGVCTKD